MGGAIRPSRCGEFELLARAAFRGHTSETAKTSIEGENGDTQVVTIERNEAVHRVTRKILWSNEARSYHLVTFREKMLASFLRRWCLEN